MTNGPCEPQIPVLDLSKWSKNASSSTKASLAKDWHAAFSSHGLVWLTNHGLDSLYNSVQSEWRNFCMLDQEEKENFSAPSYGSTGYNNIGAEAVGRSDGGEGAPDPVESLESGYENQFEGPFPREANGYKGGDALRDACRNLYKALDTKVLEPCLAIASLALDMSEQELSGHWLAEGDTAGQLRLARYLPRGGADVPELLYGEHTDYDGFTFLWRNATNGLQALIDSTWTAIPLLCDHPNAILVNLGDLMQTWTRNVWKSPRHKVVRSSGQSELVSIVWFAGPHPATQLLPLPSPLLPKTSRDARIVTAGEHVMEKIKKTAS